MIKGKLPFDNNRPLLATTITRHADSPKTLPATSPPRSGHRMKKRLNMTSDTRQATRPTSEGTSSSAISAMATAVGGCRHRHRLGDTEG
jgi:hypothetical protein